MSAVDAEAIAAFVADVGARVVRLRTDRGWTQARLARAAGITVGTLGVTERGERATDVARLWSIATALGVPMVDLIPDAGMVRPRASGR